MVRAALGVVYLLASATANGWNLLQLGLLTGINSSDDLRNRTEAGPRDRGGPSRPDPGLGGNGTWDWWSVAWDGAYHYVGNSWWIKMWVRMLLQVAENGISYCGTLCASIGLAARWSYWLLTGMVLVFLLQLLVWTYTWVIHPTWIHSRALWRYCQGTGTWSDVTRLQGQRPFIPVWERAGCRDTMVRLVHPARGTGKRTESEAIRPLSCRRSCCSEASSWDYKGKNESARFPLPV